MASFGLSTAELTELLAGLPADAKCLNPACEARLGYRTSTRGRQALYCDEVCRRTTWRARERLKANLQSVLESHDMLERPATGQQLRAAEAKLRWLLARYPAENPAQENHRDVDHVPAAVIFARMDDDWTEEALAEASRYDARMRLRFINRRSRPIPVTPSVAERQRATVARQKRIEVDGLLETLDS